MIPASVGCCAVRLLRHGHDIDAVLASGRVWVLAIVNGNTGEPTAPLYSRLVIRILAWGHAGVLSAIMRRLWV